MGNVCYYSVEKLLSSSLLSKNLNVRIYKTVIILPVVLYGCETWTLTLREEHRLRVFKNKVLRKIFVVKRDEVIEEWRKLHNTGLQVLYSSPDIIRNIKSRRLRWAGHVARMGESRNAYRVLVGRPEGKRPLGRPRRRWEDNIKMDLREVGYDDRDWINLAQDRDQWRAYVTAAMNLRDEFTRVSLAQRKGSDLFFSEDRSISSPTPYPGFNIFGDPALLLFSRLFPSKFTNISSYGTAKVGRTPPHSSTEVMESMGLYLHAPQMSSWHVTGIPLPFYYFQSMGGVIVGGRRIKCIRFADDMALLAKEMILRDMLLEVSDRYKQYGIKINANKTKSMVLGRKVKKVNLQILNEAVEQVDSFKYLGCTISSNMSCCQEVKRRIAMAKEAFNRKRSIFCGPLEKELRKRLVKCFVWSMALYGVETWTLRRSEEKRIEAFEMWIWRIMERVKWTDRIRNEVVLERVGEGRMKLKHIRKRKMNWLSHWLRRNCLLKDVLEGMVNGRRVRDRRRYQMIDDIKIYESHGETKRKAENRNDCTNEKVSRCTLTAIVKRTKAAALMTIELVSGSQPPEFMSIICIQMEALLKGKNRLVSRQATCKPLAAEIRKNIGGVKVGGRIKCIRFADDMALLAEEETILKDMLLELNDSCEQYGMKINANKTKTMVVARKIKKLSNRDKVTANLLFDHHYSAPVALTLRVGTASLKRSAAEGLKRSPRSRLTDCLFAPFSATSLRMDRPPGAYAGAVLTGRNVIPDSPLHMRLLVYQPLEILKTGERRQVIPRQHALRYR
ncbi:hypothetical protein ANN_00409 [Periplaneta americana]|uniref:Reverse transcriptase domain-containing protein n=1 Tax=Periplaneta americana TaxID=6978 RepID=A0ABQ8TTL7_PERAM|nr:hypothetical protein ANN_00409 [Periplaneta americana]